MSNGPARRAGDEAKPFLQVETVYLVDDAVDIETKSSPVGLYGPVSLEHLLFAAAELYRRQRKSPSGDRFQHAVIRIGGQLARFAPAPAKETQGPRRRNRRIELTKRTGSSVARIRKSLTAGFS